MGLTAFRGQLPKNLAQRLQQAVAVPPLVQQIASLLQQQQAQAVLASCGPLGSMLSSLATQSGAADLQTALTGLLAGAANKGCKAIDEEVIELPDSDESDRDDEDEASDEASEPAAVAVSSSSSSAAASSSSSLVSSSMLVDPVDDSRAVSIAHRVALVKSGKFVDEKV